MILVALDHQKTVAAYRYHDLKAVDIFNNLTKGEL